MRNSSDKVLHPITLRLRPFPSWDRLRIALECLLLGTVTFQAEIAEFTANAENRPPSREAERARGV